MHPNHALRQQGSQKNHVPPAQPEAQHGNHHQADTSRREQDHRIGHQKKHRPHLGAAPARQIKGQHHRQHRPGQRRRIQQSRPPAVARHFGPQTRQQTSHAAHPQQQIKNIRRRGKRIPARRHLDVPQHLTNGISGETDGKPPPRLPLLRAGRPDAQPGKHRRRHAGHGPMHIIKPARPPRRDPQPDGEERRRHEAAPDRQHDEGPAPAWGRSVLESFGFGAHVLRRVKMPFQERWVITFNGMNEHCSDRKALHHSHTHNSPVRIDVANRRKKLEPRRPLERGVQQAKDRGARSCLTRTPK